MGLQSLRGVENAKREGKFQLQRAGPF